MGPLFLPQPGPRGGLAEEVIRRVRGRIPGECRRLQGTWSRETATDCRAVWAKVACHRSFRLNLETGSIPAAETLRRPPQPRQEPLHRPHFHRCRVHCGCTAVARRIRRCSSVVSVVGERCGTAASWPHRFPRWGRKSRGAPPNCVRDWGGLQRTHNPRVLGSSPGGGTPLIALSRPCALIAWHPLPQSRTKPQRRVPMRRRFVPYRRRFLMRGHSRNCGNHGATRPDAGPAPHWDDRNGCKLATDRRFLPRDSIVDDRRSP